MSKKVAVEQYKRDIVALIRYYNKRGWDWILPVEHLCRQAQGIKPWKP